MASLAPSLSRLVAPPVTCSPRTPWGIHPILVAEACPRCGWSRIEDGPRTRR